jgi:SAM-dependent methyltransferase
LETHYKGRASVNLSEYDYQLVQCKKCQFAFQINVPTERLLSEIYDVWIPKCAREEKTEKHHLDTYRYIAEQVQYITQHFRLQPHLIDVLDFGFGWARWAKMALAFGYNVTGTELSHERIDYAQSIGLKVIEIQDLPKNKFHFINTEQVFEHLVEPRKLLVALKAALKEGGVVKISVPNAKRSLHKIKKRQDFSKLSPHEIMPIAPLEHINSYTYESLVALADSVGLRPFCPNLYKLYNSASGWLNPKNALRILLRPIYRHVFPKCTFVYFERNVLAEPV